MKRSILMIALVFLAGATFAQFTVGPKLGFTMSKLKTNFEDVKEEARAGFQFGAFARIGKKIYVQPELIFVTKGGIIKADDATALETKVKLSTMQIPALVGFHLLNLKVVNLRVMGGPALSFVTDKEIKINNVSGSIGEKNIKDAIWSFQLGAGLDVLMFTLDVRYEWGLNNIYHPQGGTTYDMKSNLWNVSLGWKIL
jgi:hypothetical protein